MRWLLHFLACCLSGTCVPAAVAQGQTPSAPACQRLVSELHSLDLCPAAIPPIAQVQIDAPAPPAKSRSGEDCRAFRPKLPAIHRFWAQAGQVNSMDYMNALDVSACGVGGVLTLQDGRQATWHIGAERRGTLRIKGAPEEKTLYLFCPHCDFAPFWDWNSDFKPVAEAGDDARP